MSTATAPGSTEHDIAIDEYAAGADGDSAYDSELQSYNTSLESSVTAYKDEHGRRYHAFKEGSYQFPNDEEEIDRMDLMHKIVELAFGNRISRAPIKNPKRVLDLGTGTGIWAIEMGDRYPNAESIIGNDLSPIQPRWVPPNVSFEVDDVEADWTYSRKFDLIHSRFFYASIKNWPRLMQQAYDHLEPGGYAEFTDADITWTSPDGSHKGTMTETVQQKFFEAMDAVGIVYSPGPRLEEWMKAQGFEDVTVQRYPLPVGSWPADKKLKEIGAYNYVQTKEGLESFFLAVFTRMLSYRKEEVDVMCAKLKQTFKDPKVHVLWNVYNVIGRKPGAK